MGSKAWTLCITPGTLCRRVEVYSDRGRDGVQILGPEWWTLVQGSKGPPGMVKSEGQKMIEEHRSPAPGSIKKTAILADFGFWCPL